MVIGGFVIGGVVGGGADEVWNSIGGEASGFDILEFGAYLEGSKRCAAIRIGNPQLLDTPFPLAFHPPQSYQFLHRRIFAHRKLLRSLAALRLSGTLAACGKIASWPMEIATPQS